jgi:hypothetical protein
MFVSASLPGSYATLAKAKAGNCACDDQHRIDLRHELAQPQYWPEMSFHKEVPAPLALAYLERSKKSLPVETELGILPLTRTGTRCQAMGEACFRSTRPMEPGTMMV